MPTQHKRQWQLFSIVTKKMCRNSCCCCICISKVCLSDVRQKHVIKVVDESIEAGLACMGCIRLCCIFPLYYFIYWLICLAIGCYAWVVLHPQSGFCIAESALVYLFEPDASSLKMFQVIISRLFFVSGQRAEVCIWATSMPSTSTRSDYIVMMNRIDVFNTIHRVTIRVFISQILLFILQPIKIGITKNLTYLF